MFLWVDGGRVNLFPGWLDFKFVEDDNDFTATLGLKRPQRLDFSKIFQHALLRLITVQLFFEAGRTCSLDET